MMMDKNGLSIVAMFDEIARNRAVLTVGVEAEFAAFVLTQEDCRKKWKQAEEAVQEMMDRLKNMEDARNVLETKLKHARNQIDVEITKRKRAEEERDAYEKQIMLVKELLRDKNNSTMLNDHARETLAFLSTDFRSMIHEKSPVVSHYRMETEDSTSALSPEISFDRTEDDLDGPRKKSKKRPSAPPCEDEENIAPLGKRNEKSAKRHRRSKSVEMELSIVGGPALAVFDDVSTPRTSTKPKDRRKSSPFAALIRSNSQGLQGESGDGWSPEMKRVNSGNSLTRPHMFQSVSLYKQDSCYVCTKKLKFGTSGAKCKDCKIQCHSQCKDFAPLPCMATVNTPKIVKSAPGLLADYAPVDRPFVPAIVIYCINEVESRGLKQEGLYRVSGSDKEVKELKEKFIKGKTPNLTSIVDINVICSCLKDFFRNLKEPLVTFNLWQSFLEAAERKDVQESTADLYQVISKLPPANRDTLAYLILHLLRISESVECRMSISNLVTVFAPTIIGFSCSDPSPDQMMQETAKQRRVMTKLMDLPSDYWSAFIRTEVHPAYQCSTPSNTGHYRILSKYEEPVSVTRTAPRSTLRPLNMPSIPGLYEGTLFQTPIGSGYADYRKRAQFFAAPVLK